MSDLEIALGALPKVHVRSSRPPFRHSDSNFSNFTAHTPDGWVFMPSRDPSPAASRPMSRAGSQNDLVKWATLNASSSAPITPPAASHPTSPLASLPQTPLASLPQSPLASPPLSRSNSQTDLTRWAAQMAAPPSDEQTTTSILEPVDRGRGAWTFVVCGFFLEAIVWGTAFCIGIFQQYYVKEFGASETVGISAIGTTLSAFSYGGCSILMPVFRKHPYYMRHLAGSGVLLSVVCLLGASFSHGVPSLIALQGVGTGFGAGLAFTPVLILLPQWFDKKRGLASGIIFSGSTFGGIGFPWLLQAALTSLGYRWSLRIYALLIAGCAPAIYFMRPRIPAPRRMSVAPQDRSRAESKPRRQSGSALQRMLPRALAFMLSKIYLLNAAMIFVLSAGYVTVSLYLSLYVETTGLSPSVATASVAILNAAAAIGQLVVGHACDHIPYELIMGAVGAVACLSSLLLWGLSTNVAAIMCFIFLFGASAGGSPSTWAASSSDVARTQNAPTTTVFTSIYAIKGISSLVGPLIAAALLAGEQHGSPLRVTPFGSYGYASLISFVAACMAASGALGLAIHLYKRTSLRGVDFSAVEERL